MRLSITSNIASGLTFLDSLNKQFPFTVAKTLTDLAKEVQKDIPAQLQKSIDRPTPFTSKGTFVTPARKTNFEAVVGFKDKQAAYMTFQVEGGTRVPARKALRLPSNVELNQYGNLPAGLIKKLVARAKAGKGVTRAQSRKFGISTQAEIFYGDPGHGRPPGLYQRTFGGLVPIVVFPARPAHYRKRYDFYGDGAKIVKNSADDTLARNWALAKVTAK